MLAFGRWLGLAVRLVLGAAGLVVASARAEAPFSFDGTPGQLPKTVVPHHYAIRLETDLSNSADRTNFTTRGTVTVALEAAGVVHAAEREAEKMPAGAGVVFVDQRRDGNDLGESLADEFGNEGFFAEN